MGIIIALVVLTLLILGNSTNEKLIEWVERYSYPLITLLIGFLTGKSAKVQPKTS